MPMLDTSNNRVVVNEVKPEDIKLSVRAVMAIDGSSTNSGIAIIREKDGAIMYIIRASREEEETIVQYKVRLKRILKDILGNNILITQTYYEEPVVANIAAVKALFTLRTFIEEMIVEEEPKFDYLQHYEVSNMRWKKELLAPAKVPSGTEMQKKAVRDRLVGALPFLNSVTQDELDAIGLGFTAVKFIMQGSNIKEELESKKKSRPFKFYTQFIGADDDECALIEFSDIYKGPDELLTNGIKMVEITSRNNFEETIYSNMGSDDKILLIKFKSKHHGDVILKYRVGELAESYDYIYVIVWRCIRKR